MMKWFIMCSSPWQRVIIIQGEEGAPGIRGPTALRGLEVKTNTESLKDC